MQPVYHFPKIEHYSIEAAEVAPMLMRNRHPLVSLQPAAGVFIRCGVLQAHDNSHGSYDLTPWYSKLPSMITPVSSNASCIINHGKKMAIGFMGDAEACDSDGRRAELKEEANCV